MRNVVYELECVMCHNCNYITIDGENEKKIMRKRKYKLKKKVILKNLLKKSFDNYGYVKYCYECICDCGNYCECESAYKCGARGIVCSGCNYNCWDARVGDKRKGLERRYGSMYEKIAQYSACECGIYTNGEKCEICTLDEESSSGYSSSEKSEILE